MLLGVPEFQFGHFGKGAGLVQRFGGLHAALTQASGAFETGVRIAQARLGCGTQGGCGIHLSPQLLRSLFEVNGSPGPQLVDGIGQRLDRHRDAIDIRLMGGSIIEEVGQLGVVDELAGDRSYRIIETYPGAQWPLGELQTACDRRSQRGQTGIHEGIAACSGQLFADDYEQRPGDNDQSHHDPQQLHPTHSLHLYFPN
ncbi:hypothetical protein [Mycoplana dimorpha]|uniref:hypothetical protein n=1 Tax=Mycoplana dimorpha TaxID=28320 RepID=UPI0035BB9EFB